MEFEIKMDFDLYTGIVSYNMVTAFMLPLWAEQSRYNSNTTIIIIINVFCRSPTWEVSIVLFAFVMVEACSRTWLDLLYCFTGRSSYGRFSAGSCSGITALLWGCPFIPAQYNEQVLLLHEGDREWGEVNLEINLVGCLLSVCSPLIWTSNCLPLGVVEQFLRDPWKVPVSHSHLHFC